MDETTPYRPTVHTQADLEEVWRHLMGPWGFSGRSIWMLHVDPDGDVAPQIVEIAECDRGPDPALTDGLAALLGELEEADPGGRWAFLVSRPGRGVHESDRMWARFLHEAATRAGVRLETTHLATDDGVTPLPADDLLPRSA